MDSRAVIGAAIRDSTKESRNACSPRYLVNTCSNHLKVSGVNLYPHVGKSAPIGTQIYIMMTNAAPTAQKIVSGIFTLLSSISIRARLALPVSVAAVFLSR